MEHESSQNKSFHLLTPDDNDSIMSVGLLIHKLKDKFSKSAFYRFYVKFMVC